MIDEDRVDKEGYWSACYVISYAFVPSEKSWRIGLDVEKPEDYKDFEGLVKLYNSIFKLR